MSTVMVTMRLTDGDGSTMDVMAEEIEQEVFDVEYRVDFETATTFAAWWRSVAKNDRAHDIGEIEREGVTIMLAKVCELTRDERGYDCEPYRAVKLFPWQSLEFDEDVYDLDDFPFAEVVKVDEVVSA